MFHKIGWDLQIFIFENPLLLIPPFNQILVLFDSIQQKDEKRGRIWRTGEEDQNEVLGEIHHHFDWGDEFYRKISRRLRVWASTLRVQSSVRRYRVAVSVSGSRYASGDVGEGRHALHYGLDHRKTERISTSSWKDRPDCRGTTCCPTTISEDPTEWAKPTFWSSADTNQRER